MGRQDRPALTEAVAPFDHVLLEHWATFCGRQLSLCVTTADAERPDTVAVHVCYGNSQAEVTVTADGDEKSSGSSEPPPRAGDAPVVEPPISPVTEHQEVASRSRGQKRDSTSVAVGVSNPAAKHAKTTSKASAELNPVTLAENTTKQGQATSSAIERNETPSTCSMEQGHKLRIGRFDEPGILEDETLEEMLRAMPGLRSLSIEWRLDGQKLDIDVVSQHCRSLVEIDLTRFRLDAWSLEQLCVACPELKVIKLPRKCDDSFVEVLLRKLPHLRSLDLANTKVTGRFLAQPNDSVEQLSLACCSSLKFEQLRMVHLFAGDPSQQVVCWKQLRELDLSSTTVSSADVTDVFKHFPQLERLSLARCTKFESASLLQAAQCERLQDLDVSHVGRLQASDLLTILSRCSQLKRLVFAGCEVLEPSSLRQIEQSSVDLCLRELDVSAARGLVIDDLAAILARSPRLERLYAPDFENVELTNCLVQMRRCTELHEMDFSRPKAPPAPLKSPTQGRPIQPRMPEQQKSAETVSVRRGFIYPSALSSLLQSCQKLERLLLADCQISESTSLRQLAQCPRLRELDLSRVASVDPDDLAQGLSGCPLLERLSVAGMGAPLEQLVPPTGFSRLTYLDVSRSGMTNNSLRRIRRLFPKLHTLNMQGCQAVTEGGLMTYLPRLRQLRSLDLRDVAGVTKALLVKLKGSHLTKLRLNDVHQRGYSSHLNTEDVANLALDCQSLKFLEVEDPCSDLSKEVRNMIERNLSPQCAFILCVSRHQLSAPKFQPGPLFEVDTKAVDWDKD